MANTYTRIDSAERKLIQNLLNKGYNYSQIAQVLKRSPSSISRECQKTLEGKSYNLSDAQKITEIYCKRKSPKMLTNHKLRNFVISKLRLYWSPDQISKELQKVCGMDNLETVSKETIYTYIYVLAKGNLKKELISCLRQRKKTRIARTRGKDCRGQIPDMISISERPAETEARRVPGHWEGDLIMGKENKSAIATLVERSTRYVMLLPLKNKDAHSVRLAMQRGVKHLPQSLKKSLTYDLGKEISEHKLFTKKSKMQVYFADPYGPWQRGTNENTNGLIRQFFPKGTDFNGVSHYHIKKVERLLNERPRQTLDFRKPYEVFAEKLDNCALEA